MEGGGAAIHPGIAPISFLLGTWRGEGEGGFPTIQSFKYGEEIKFTHSGKPVIAYTQKTWKLASGEPMHAESGYWRPKLDGSIEVIIAQSTGLAEVQKGTYDADKKIVNLKSDLVGNASKVKEITRVFELIGNDLSYVVGMETITHTQQPHLKALLKKI
uniref:THAP4-like heme-binding domain-containing protein n=1 Tax=Araucaria cunninghamii TaxID=56994 RepID=A0A0D6R806_ARACU